MSTYGDFIEEILDKEYSLIETFKNDEFSKVELFENKTNSQRLIRIISKNRNDHIFRSLRGLKHENLPLIYDACSCEEHLCILESYVEGETLAKTIEREKISTKATVKYVLDICNALSFLHSKKIIHRDVKPSNVIITPADRAVLIDLQAARSTAEDREKDTNNLGTVGYAAPEQFGVFQSSPPTDIYALGVLFNEMLLDTHPSVKTPSGKLGKIIKKCTDTQISKRYQTVDALISDLKAYQKFHH